MSAQSKPPDAHVPLVSIIVPTYNRAADVIRCLDSLLAQTFRDFEVLVCDDGSTDGTAEVVERFRDRLDVHYHWAENFGGPARPRNNGIRLSRGKYVAFLDSDDWWAPRKLERSLAAMEAGADLIYHDMYMVRTAAQSTFRARARTRPLEKPVFADLLRNGNALATSSVVTRRDLLLRIGGFSEDRTWIGWEDFDTWLRIAQLTDRFQRLDEPLGYYWFGGGNISTPQRLLTNLGAFREKYVERDGAPLSSLPSWYHYLMGRGFYMSGAHAKVGAQMRLAFAAGLPAALKAKAMYWAALATFRRMAVGA